MEMNSGSDDAVLLERIRRGDNDGAAELFERYAPALLRFTDRMLSDRAAAEEVTQEVFVKVISRAHQYDGRAGGASGLLRTRETAGGVSRGGPSPSRRTRAGTGAAGSGAPPWSRSRQSPSRGLAAKAS